MSESATITSVHFRNFKTYKNFSVALRHVNILVGPNNSGKSTIVGAMRVLAGGIQKARVRNPERIVRADGPRYGYPISRESIPISMENVQTDYSDAESIVTFRLSNGNNLALHFLPDECIMFPEVQRSRITTIAGFKQAFPISVYVVPVLGPVEHEEELLQEETIRRGLATHRASRHFRNYWYRFPEQFIEFKSNVGTTWPGMDVEPPRLEDPLDTKLTMFCLEDRVPRELYWAGSGFQIWCQLLTHLVRGVGATLFVVDEPEIYLHPDLQRQLLAMLRELGPDVLIATHSSELVGDADPSDILLIDKKRQAARRVAKTEAVREALAVLGSVQNSALTQLARTRRALFVEGSEFAILSQFAWRMGLVQLAAGRGIAIISLGGFPPADRVHSTCRGMREALGDPLAFGAVFDRDFRCDEEVEAITQQLRGDLSFTHILSRKETENYLLSPGVIERAIDRALAEQAQRSRKPKKPSVDVTGALEHITTSRKGYLQSQYVARGLRFFFGDHRDPATLAEGLIARFDGAWTSLETRLHIVGGKETLAALNQHLQAERGVSLSLRGIISAFQSEEIPRDLKQTIREIEKLRTH
jgi:energy-coupling factor transporter ATP-binding protein EcfA2